MSAVGAGVASVFVTTAAVSVVFAITAGATSSPDLRVATKAIIPKATKLEATTNGIFRFDIPEPEASPDEFIPISNRQKLLKRRDYNLNPRTLQSDTHNLTDGYRISPRRTIPNSGICVSGEASTTKAIALAASFGSSAASNFRLNPEVSNNGVAMNPGYTPVTRMP